MSTPTIDPIAPEWSTREVPTATARQLALSLSRYDVHEVDAWRAELRAAVAELAFVAGRPWELAEDEPTIALLRAAAVLAGRSPEVAGVAAAELVAALGG